MVLGVGLLAATASAGTEDELIAFMADAGEEWGVYVMSPDGTGQTLLTPAPGHDGQPVLSPDGSKIAFTSQRDGDDEIYVMATDGSGQRNISNDPANRDMDPAWSPDGTKIAFRKGPEIYVMNADGSEPISLTNRRGVDRSPDWSPDGRRIAFSSHFGDEVVHIHVMDATDGSDRMQLTRDASANRNPAWSPDGTRIAYESSGTIKTMNADGSGSTSLTTGWEPAWSPDGTKIAFTGLDGIVSGWFDIVVIDAAGGSRTNLTATPDIGEGTPHWGIRGTVAPPDSDGDGVPDADDAFPEDPYESSDGDGDGLGDNGDPDTVGDAAARLPAGAFRSRGHGSAMEARLEAAEALIHSGDTDGARTSLENLRRRLDGCEAGGADADDWIVDCSAQDEIRALLDTLLATLD